LTALPVLVIASLSDCLGLMKYVAFVMQVNAGIQYRRAIARVTNSGIIGSIRWLK
jgi:hypothetical protein